MQKKLISKKNLILFSILLVASFLRLYRIADYMTFLGDEGRDVIVAFNILHGHLTLLGPTASVGGFFLGPIYYYFMAPFLLLFNYSPVGPAVMVALFGVFTVWLVYKVGSEFFGAVTGFIAAFLYAISPIVITYSHSSWNPNLMPPFSLLTLYLLYKAITKKCTWLFFVCGILYGILMQLHYIEVFIGVVIFFYLLLTVLIEEKEAAFLKIKTLGKQYFLFGLGALVGLSPFLAFEFRHGFQNITSVFHFIFHSQETSAVGVNFFGTIGDVFFRLFGRLVLAYPIQDKLDKHLFAHILWWNSAVCLLAILSTAIFLFMFFRLIQKKAVKKESFEKFSEYLLIFLWLFFGVILFGFYKNEIHDYYFEFMFPLPFLLVGNAFSFFWRRQIYWKAFALLSFLGIVLINIAWNPFQFTPNRQLHQMETIASFVYSKTDNKPYNFALMSSGNSDHAYRYFFMMWGNPPISMENLLNDSTRKTVTDQLLLICELPVCHPLGYPLFEVAGFGRADIAGQWDVTPVKVFKLIHYQGK